jgi:hypothetical protein
MLANAIKDSHYKVAKGLGYGLTAMMHVKRCMVFLWMIIGVYFLYITLTNYINEISQPLVISSLILGVGGVGYCIIKLIECTEALTFTRWLKDSDRVKRDSAMIIELINSEDGLIDTVSTGLKSKISELKNFEDVSIKSFKGKIKDLKDNKNEIAELCDKFSGYRSIFDGAKALIGSITDMFGITISIVCALLATSYMFI